MKFKQFRHNMLLRLREQEIKKRDTSSRSSHQKCIHTRKSSAASSTSMHPFMHFPSHKEKRHALHTHTRPNSHCPDRNVRTTPTIMTTPPSPRPVGRNASLQVLKGFVFPADGQRGVRVIVSRYRSLLLDFVRVLVILVKILRRRGGRRAAGAC